MEKEMKNCSVCGELKELNEFYSRKQNSRKRGEYIYYRPECKECTKERSEDWRKDPENREAFLAINKKRNQQPHHKKSLENAYERRRKEGYFKDYYQENTNNFKGYNEKHKEKRFNVTDEEWNGCLEYFNNSCAYCGIENNEAKKIYNHKLHQEHAINKGANDLSNCLPSCRGCNSKKWERDYVEWYVEGNEAYEEGRHNKIIQWLEKDYKKYIKMKEMTLHK